jgi:hypothetical protein
MIDTQYDDIGGVHLIETNEWVEHIPASSCWCRPVDAGDNVWVHNDAREADDDVAN